MTITARIECDSINMWGNRLTTFVLKYPRFIHSQIMTHRVFSRSSSSSRAIPTKKIIDNIVKDLAMPVFWGKNQAGMQATEELCESDILDVKSIWTHLSNMSTQYANLLSQIGLHKQITNRVIENFSHIEVIVTATTYSNFFKLRRHKDAEPEIQELANKMFECYMYSQPKFLHVGQWHLPFITEEEKISSTGYFTPELLRKFSAARCARVSYLTHEGREPRQEDDLNLFNRLVTRDNLDEPKHLSPLEHVATPLLFPRRCGNFKGWKQLRKFIKGESGE